MKSKSWRKLASKLLNRFGPSQLVHTETTGQFKEGDLITLSDLGRKVFGDATIGMVLRGPYEAYSFSYDITPFTFVAYDVYLNGSRYRDFSESYLAPLKEKI